MKLKQIFCVHWFDEGPNYQYEYSAGQFVCAQQRIFQKTVQPRTCSKCGYNETRQVGDITCLGWE